MYLYLELCSCSFWMLYFKCDEGEINLGGKNWGRAWGQNWRADMLGFGPRDLKVTIELTMV